MPCRSGKPPPVLPHGWYALRPCVPLLRQPEYKQRRYLVYFHVKIADSPNGNTKYDGNYGADGTVVSDVAAKPR